jgi:hypothetical protein
MSGRSASFGTAEEHLHNPNMKRAETLSARFFSRWREAVIIQKDAARLSRRTDSGFWIWVTTGISLQRRELGRGLEANAVASADLFDLSKAFARVETSEARMQLHGKAHIRRSNVD